MKRREVPGARVAAGALALAGLVLTVLAVVVATAPRSVSVGLASVGESGSEPIPGPPADDPSSLVTPAEDPSSGLSVVGLREGEKCSISGYVDGPVYSGDSPVAAVVALQERLELGLKRNGSSEAGADAQDESPVDGRADAEVDALAQLIGRIDTSASTGENTAEGVLFETRENGVRSAFVLVAHAEVDANLLSPVAATEGLNTWRVAEFGIVAPDVFCNTSPDEPLDLDAELGH